jgi:hypothetical protein
MIAALIEAEPDGAWSYDDLCAKIYKGAPNPARLSAVGRALANMMLPGTWTCGQCDDRRRWLYDECNLASVRKAHPDLAGRHFQPGGRVFERVEAAKRYRDASPVEKIDADIAGLQIRMGYLGVALQAGFDRAACEAKIRKLVARIAELEAERARLAPAEPLSSAPPRSI